MFRDHVMLAAAVRMEPSCDFQSTSGDFISAIAILNFGDIAQLLVKCGAKFASLRCQAIQLRAVVLQFRSDEPFVEMV